MKISVLLATFNAAPFLKEQIDSILVQKNVDLELIIRDDGSADNTLEICGQYVKSDSRVKMLNVTSKSKGASSNFYTLLRQDLIDSSYIALADQDDIWEPDKLSRAVKLLQSTGADGYSCDVMAFYPNGEKFLVKKSFEQKEFDFLFEGPGPGSTFVITKKAHCSLKSFLDCNLDLDENAPLHDWFIYAFLRSKGMNWVIDDYVGLNYRQHENNVIGVNKGILAVVRRLKSVIWGEGLLQAFKTRNMLYGNENSPYPCPFESKPYWFLFKHADKFRRRKSDVNTFRVLIGLLWLKNFFK